MKIGFIGLGAMGAPMAALLVRAGHAVKGFDVRAKAIEALVAAGGQAAHSAADAAQGAELLWLMVVNGEQAASVLFDSGAAADLPERGAAAALPERGAAAALPGRGAAAVAPLPERGAAAALPERGAAAALPERGAAAALPRGALVVAACTQAPASAKALADRLAALGLRMLDAPVSGGVAGAKAAKLTVMCSGAEADMQTARPIFDALAGRVFHVGAQAGQGSTAKMINQLLCGVHIAAAAEAMHLAERSGVALETLHEIIGVSAGNSWMWGDRGPRMMSADPPVTSAVDIFVKDLGIVLGQAKELRAGLPLASAAMQMFLAASGLGHGAADDSQVIRAYRALNGGGTR